MDMTEEQRYMMEGVDAFMQRLEYSFEKDKKTLERLRQICEQTYYDIAFFEVDNYDENLFNVFNIRTTEDEKQELSDKLFQFHDDYENNFSDYFDLEDDEALDDFLYWYKGLYELIGELLKRW